MLSNPHWNAPSLSSFEFWLESKDPQEKYNYSDCENCACAQYLKHVGKYDRRWLFTAKVGEPLHRMNGIASGNLWEAEPNRGHTFGQLLGRVRAHRQLVAA